MKNLENLNKKVDFTSFHESLGKSGEKMEK